jgi:hypothetical protein
MHGHVNVEFNNFQSGFASGGVFVHDLLKTRQLS